MLSKRNQKQIQAKLQTEMKAQGVDAMILTSPEAIYYATGYASSFLYTTGTAGYCLGLVPAEGPCEVIMMEMENQTARAQCKDVVVHTYPTWIYIDDEGMDEGEKPEQPDMDAPMNIFAEIILSRKSDAKVGMELPSLPYPRYERVKELFGRNLVDCTDLLRKVRAVKTEWEIDLLCRAAKSAERAMFETAGYLRPGMTQKNVMDLFREACFRQDPEIDGWGLIPSIGKYYSTMELAVEDVILEEGDIVRIDGGPHIHKYTSDLCRTVVIGKPRPGQQELLIILKKGHDRAMEIIGPGVRMCDVFDEVMAVLKKEGGLLFDKYVRGHFGHSIGCNNFVEEYPFISPTNTDVFEPGMVFCIETPFYSGKLGGFNLEDEILITENGYERWTYVNDDLRWGQKY